MYGSLLSLEFRSSIPNICQNSTDFITRALLEFDVIYETSKIVVQQQVAPISHLLCLYLGVACRLKLWQRLMLTCAIE
jgi:hypothetical protein